ncbi:PREDICTED: uncharacterized protein LOC104811950 [Tarenaya hassleriana]|uniref:uncharacterized protein LOC104811950 n=1 Tax=Tarenaya hassleriana TaxID=28532 RepID=UPI00053C8902|nr:PREDICTED: uncharacterized protein LOC104811950 [Tarenaya hassleriana]
MQKAVFLLSIHDIKIRKKAFVTVSAFPGVSSVGIDEKNEKMTVIGSMDMDVPTIVMKLRKICDAKIDTVEPVKKPEPKKPEPPKPEPPKPVVFHHPVMPMTYHPNYDISHYPVYPTKFVENEDPNSCVIC